MLHLEFEFGFSWLAFCRCRNNTWSGQLAKIVSGQFVSFKGDRCRSLFLAVMQFRWRRSSLPWRSANLWVWRLCGPQIELIENRYSIHGSWMVWYSFNVFEAKGGDRRVFRAWSTIRPNLCHYSYGKFWTSVCFEDVSPQPGRRPSVHPREVWAPGATVFVMATLEIAFFTG